MPRTGMPTRRRASRCALPTNPKPITAAACFIAGTPVCPSSPTCLFPHRLQSTSFQKVYNRNFNQTENLEVSASQGRMLPKEMPVSTPNRKLSHIVIVLVICMAVALPCGADNAASGVVDSQTFLQRNGTPAGPPANSRPLRNRYGSRGELRRWKHSFSAAPGDGGDVESGVDVARQPDCGRGNAQGGNSMVILAGA